MTQLTQALAWRYATKKFDATKKLADEDVTALLDAARLSPSSFGIQPSRFIIVENPAIRERIKAAAWNQSQVTDASHLLVIAVRRTLTAEDIDAYVADIAQTRGVTTESLKGYRDMMLGTISNRTPEQLLSWNQKQAYIALGTLLAAAADMRIDATPMEGFDPAAVDAILGFEHEGLAATVLVPLGYRAADDGYANLKKVRYPLQKIVKRVS